MMSDDSATLAVETLRQVVNRALDHVRDVKSDQVELEKDYFWSIPTEELYDVYSRPENLTVGQVTESWENLRSLLARGDAVPGYALVWIADVLRALGNQLSS